MPNKKPFEILLYVERVISLQSWVAKKSCHGQTLMNECSIFDYPSKLIFHSSIQIKVSNWHLKMALDRLK